VDTSAIVEPSLLDLSLAGCQSVETDDKTAKTDSCDAKSKGSNHPITFMLQPGRVCLSLKSTSGALNLFHFSNLENNKKG
jgi:hypothetical protein